MINNIPSQKRITKAIIKNRPNVETEKRVGTKITPEVFIVKPL